MLQYNIMNCSLPWSLWIVDALPHCTPILSPVSDVCKKKLISGWSVTSKRTLMITGNFIYTGIWPYPWEKVIRFGYGVNVCTVTVGAYVSRGHLSVQTFSLILILGVCILLHVWNQGEGFPSMQRYCVVVFTIHSFLLHVSVVWPSLSRNNFIGNYITDVVSCQTLSIV
jgi:hypothetical protein